jgi:hypothetical protein
LHNDCDGGLEIPTRYHRSYPEHADFGAGSPVHALREDRLEAGSNGCGTGGRTMSASTFEEVSDHWDKETGGERHIRKLSDRFWVSVLHRLTGFGWWEWETAIVIVRDDSDRKVLIVRGDHRETLADKTEAEILDWYSEHSEERNSLETIINALKEVAK